ncbi:hypothetical protein [Capillimicrobium parvum]|uniref:Uncharacterized protein n=1 Tax=Capillimicrobium parvum TaxID=2884022 RepID=A0A9E6XZ98_9ACTN|nr:hypothetical protein [Capillimicrobium parvum]UGS37224.1 hypothetical protein DSM104329_03639 [Capillimicrobium parvum]
MGRPIGQLPGTGGVCEKSPGTTLFTQKSRMARRVEIAAGGSADWSTPVRVDDAQLQAAYEGLFSVRLAVDGTSHYLKMRIVGVDEMENEFTSETGKWAGIGGKVPMLLNYMSTDLAAKAAGRTHHLRRLPRGGRRDRDPLALDESFRGSAVERLI